MASMTKPILVVSFEPTILSGLTDTITYYYNSLDGDHEVVTEQFILDDSLGRLRNDLKDIVSDTSSLQHVKMPSGDQVVMHGNERILIMEVKTDSLIFDV